MKIPSLIKILSWLFILAGIGLAFYAGYNFVRADLTPTLVTPSPTPAPTPDLAFTVNAAYRLSQPDQIYDYAIIELTITPGSNCTDANPKCLFDRRSILLSPELDNSHESFRPAAPPTVPTSIQLVQLIDTRQMATGTTETGQVYFLIPPDLNDYVLTYQGRGDTPISFQPLP